MIWGNGQWDGRAFDRWLTTEPADDHDCFDYGNLSFHAHGAECGVCGQTYGYDENGQVTR